jgi:uroporphyrinogen decarboxylase
MGINFEIDDAKGPLLARTYRSAADVASVHALDVATLPFIGESLAALRAEVGPAGAAVLGFVGSPWTLATYCVEGASSSTYRTIKSMIFSAPDVLAALLTKLADAIADYAVHQAHSGAHAIQLFDSWGGQLPPRLWDQWSAPYLRTIIDAVHSRAPGVPVTLYANGSGGLLERLGGVGADVVGLDWSVDMADARARLGGAAQPVQGNVDPVVLFAGEAAIEAAVRDVLAKAGPTGHVLNLGHGVLVGTPEDAVGHMFALSKAIKAPVAA